MEMSIEWQEILFKGLVFFASLALTLILFNPNSLLTKECHDEDYKVSENICKNSGGGYYHIDDGSYTLLSTVLTVGIYVLSIPVIYLTIIFIIICILLTFSRFDFENGF